MTAGSLSGPLRSSRVAWSPSYPVFFAAWVLAGAASAGLFYAPAFAALTAWYGDRRVRAITTLTLAAGFSSTIFAPLTALSPRAHLATDLPGPRRRARPITLPLHWSCSAGPGPGLLIRDGRPDRQILTSRTFILSTVAGTLMAFACFASLVYLVPLLTDHGMSPAWAAWALGLGGAGQVAGRLLYPRLTAASTRAPGYTRHLRHGGRPRRLARPGRHSS